MVHVSVIGCGNMGGAIVRGLAGSDHRVTACDVDEERLADLAGDAVETTTDPTEAARAPVVILAVKPAVVGEVLDDLDLEADQTLVSIAAGVSTDFLSSRTEGGVVRMMPNLAAEYGEMAAAVTPSPGPDLERILTALGTYVTIEEQHMDLATAINGSGPAFVFYLIGAMQDAGVEGGFDAEAASTLAAQTFKGAAETVLQSEQSVEELIDAVCSPKGTTIEGMNVLWDSDVEAVIGEAVGAAERRSAELTREVADE